jgi:hypothetical protein
MGLKAKRIFMETWCFNKALIKGIALHVHMLTGAKFT